jgi:hypothetical protein
MMTGGIFASNGFQELPISQIARSAPVIRSEARCAGLAGDALCEMVALLHTGTLAWATVDARSLQIQAGGVEPKRIALSDANGAGLVQPKYHFASGRIEWTDHLLPTQSTYRQRYSA